MASYPLAHTVASLSARRPVSGGVYSFARETFGPRITPAVGSLFVLWYVIGAPAVSLIAASYLAFAFPLPRIAVYVIAAILILGAFLINYRGIVVSIKFQFGIIAAIVALLVTTVAVSSFQIRLESFTPFLPEGIRPVGVAAALIFWSYLGYENVSNIAEEFKDPKRDFHRSIVVSVLVISTLYISVALATVGTQAYKAEGSVAPFAAMLSNVLGTYGAVGTAVLAVIIIFGTMNAYTIGMSRVVYAAAKEGAFPRFLDRVHAKTGVPNRSLALLSGFSLVVLVFFYFADVSLQTALLTSSGAAIMVYVIGSASGVRLLKEPGLKKLYPWISLAVSLVMLPFVGLLLLVSLAVAAFSLLYRRT